jgi:hypothetical protein
MAVVYLIFIYVYVFFIFLFWHKFIHFRRDKMKNNAGWIVQCHSKDDHLVPIAEARVVAEKVQKPKFSKFRFFLNQYSSFPAHSYSPAFPPSTLPLSLPCSHSSTLPLPTPALPLCHSPTLLYLYIHTKTPNSYQKKCDFFCFFSHSNWYFCSNLTFFKSLTNMCR